VLRRRHRVTAPPQGPTGKQAEATPSAEETGRSVPFREFVLKVAARCDLKCTYCYMYSMADQGWQTQPRFMAPATVDRIGRAVADHVSRHQVGTATFMLHGGEPLLAGPDRLRAITESLRRVIPDTTRVTFSLQTNGLRLDERVVSALASDGVRICVSIDGDAESHDRHRRRADGSGSFTAVAAAVRLLGQPRHRATFAGLLCVIDPANDPATVYRTLAGFAPPTIDFLFPHGNWSAPPPERSADDSVPYGRWLAEAFDVWYDSPPGRPEVRLFRETITLLLGGNSRTEQIGLSPAAMVVFNVDGSIEQVDSLRSAFDGAAGTRMSVFTHTLDAALRHPGIVSRQQGLRALSDQCRACPVVRVCGGGHYVHRYRAGSGFQNPSVFCVDLEYFIRRVRERVAHDIAGLVGTA
jgi:uncharacterized protein